MFCDIRKEDFTIDAGKIERLITDKTSAIIPVHVYGNICEVEKIQKIADKIAGIFVPIVVMISLLTFIIWLIIDGGFNPEHCITYAISVLVVSCPCALGLATPVAIMTATGKGSY